MKRPLDTDYLSWYYETKQNLESAHKRQRIFAHPTSKSKLIRGEMYQYIENHNTNIDTQINSELNKLIVMLKDVIIDNDIAKLQQLISHGILAEIKDMNTKNDTSFITEIIGCILQYNREEALLIISPFIDCKYFDINKFDKPILSDPYKIVLFLHSNNYIDLRASHCKLFHKAIEFGHYHTVKYCIDNNVPVDSCQNRAIRDAARYGHLETVQLLHAYGGNLHAYQDECLRKAARHGHLHVLQYLIEKGGNIHAKRSEALQRSIENGHKQCADLLIKSGVNKEENVYITKAAVKHKQYDCLSLLIKYGYVLYDEQLRISALSPSVTLDNIQAHNVNNFMTIISEKDMYESESSVSPSLSPQYMNSNNSPQYACDSDTFTQMTQMVSYNNDTIDAHYNVTQSLLDAISEGLALRETIVVSILTQYIVQEIAYIIYSFEKLALTEEDQYALMHNKKTK